MKHVQKTGLNQPVKVALIGAGARGSDLCEHFLPIPHRATVVAVAEPVEARRNRFADRHGIPPESRFETWRDFFSGPVKADAVIVATMDHDHKEPALAALEQGYNLLLEKPMAPNLIDIVEIGAVTAAACERHGTVAGVVHPLRYGPSFRKLKDLVDGRRVGDLITLDHVEQVGWWHYAHSFVRGNWRREDESSFMLLTKSCHDIDYLCYLVGKPVTRVSSFGGLSFFRRENAPAGSADRCTECSIEPECDYSAVRWYVATDREKWPAAVVADDHSRDAHLNAIATGPYGRCVWKSDNDVVDHQVVNLEFEGGVTATFTMTAFTQRMARRSRLHGTRGEIDFYQDGIQIRDFGSDVTETIDFGDLSDGHGGSDSHIIEQFVRAVAENKQELITTSIPESISTHTVTFAAEHARLTGQVVNVQAFAGG